jgi:beta-lactamase class A
MADDAWLDPLRADLNHLGITAYVHARDVDRHTQLGVRADEPMPIASTFKVLVVLELCRQAAAGEYPLTERVTVPVEGRTYGGSGLSVFADPVSMSLRDLALLALSVSDNAATDVLVRRVSAGRINATAAELDLPSLNLPGTLDEVFTHHGRQLGYASLAELIEAERRPGYDADQGERRLRESDLVTGRDSITGTARDLARLLTLIWRDEAGPAAACAQTRELLRHQVGGQRLPSGFPENDIEIASKCGTLPYARHECGVVEYPDGGRYAVAVLTHTADHARRRPEHDRMIGRLARAAVDALRAPERTIAGGVNQVVRIGATVRRPVAPWTPTVQALLRHLADEGFTGAPRPYGIDGAGREMVAHVEGEVPAGGTMPAYLTTDACVEAVARLLRRYHDASAGFAALHAAGWQFPARAPAQVICHGDVAPYNCVFRDGRPVALIDFDTAHPGPRLWDLGYAAYRFVPLRVADGDGTAEQARRLRLFCAAYGLSEADRRALPAVAAERLRALVEHMRSQAAAGQPAFRRHLEEGHHRIYLADIAYLERADLT